MSITVTRKFSKTTQIFDKHKYRYFIPMATNPEALKKIADVVKANQSKEKTSGQKQLDIQNFFEAKVASKIGDNNNFTTIEKLSELFQATTVKGKFTYEIIKDFYNIKDIESFVKICYLNTENMQKIINEEDYKTDICYNINVNDIIFPNKIISDSNDEEMKNSNLTGINKFDKNVYHTKQYPGLSTIQIMDPNLRACLKQSQELSVFFNLINTIDMSMAMPYINIKLLLPSIVNENVEYITASFSNFLFGNDKKEKKFNNIAKAINGDFYIDKYEYTKYVQNNLGNFNKKDVNLDRKTIDLSLFTMPQTIVNGDEKFYGDYESFDPKDLDGRLSIIHDKFRPFMSIESIDFDVRPTKELMSFKTATMNLILYDKSRLNEVLALVKPDLLGAYGSELLIEYGWQHILGDTDYVSEDAINPIAEFINSLKNFEKYQITNSSYSIQENGQVNITLNITMKGPLDIRGTPVFHDFLEYSTLKQLKHIIQNIKDLKVYEDDEPNKIHFSLEGNLKDSLLETMNEENIDDFINNFNAFFNSKTDVNQLQPLKNLKENVIDSLNKIKNSKKIIDKKNLEQLKSETGILSFLNGHEIVNDPYLKESKNDIVKTFQKKEYISLGKVILSLLGKLLAASHNYDEIQIVFFNLNEKAIRARGMNIAEIPIEVKDFEEYISKLIINSDMLSIEGIMNLILKRYVNERAATVYGLTKFLKINDNSESEYTFDVAASDADADQVSQKKQEYEKKILSEIFNQYYPKQTLNNNTYEYDLTFKLPIVKMSFDTMIHEKSNSSLLLRINFYDENDNPYESMFDLLNNFQNNSVTRTISQIGFLTQEFKNPQPDDKEYKKKIAQKNKQIIEYLKEQNIVSFFDDNNKSVNEISQATKVSINVEENSIVKGRNINNLKTIFKELLPSITFGMPNSAAISANVSSMNDARLSTVLMTRESNLITKQNKALKIVENIDKMPSRIIPSQVSAKIIGCPIVNFNQIIFFDFNTGTTIDNAYAVTGIKHSLGPGKFETDLTLTLCDSYAKFMVNSSTIQNFLQLKSSDEQENIFQIGINLEDEETITEAKKVQERAKSKKSKFIISYNFV